ncbi:phosphatidate cytidylyltransferase [Mucisphaera calidilacus]|nr:phosphatidate cytidylyltransferase [Mucisphaera calidilacus]
MLIQRIISSSLMITTLLIIIAVDDALDDVRLGLGTIPWLPGEGERIPRGILMLLLLLAALIPLTREMVRMMSARGSRLSWGFGYLSAAAGATCLYTLPHGPDGSSGSTALAGLLAAVLFLSVVQPLRRGEREGAIMSAAAALLCAVYLGLMPGFFLVIRWWHPAWTVVAIILITKASDIGAYFTGRWLGRTPLIPLISPKKTVEGLLGGLILSSVVAVAIAAASNAGHHSGHWITGQGEPVFIPYDYPLLYVAALGAFLGLVGQFGDLIASLFKRDAALKDSGGTVPGFGGVLDVLDSLLLAAPVGYALLRFTAWWLAPDA